MASNAIICTLSCPNAPGIVASVSGYLFASGYNILDAAQFDDVATGNFFMRVECSPSAGATGIASLREGFEPLARRWGMSSWQIRDVTERMRVMLLVSKFHHCLTDILYRWRIGELDMEIVGIVSNHPLETLGGLDLCGLPFHHLPVAKGEKAAQEELIWKLVQETKADLVVLARYMQILSDDLASKLSGKCINIHHSFLPSFKGAKPYHQAFDRGVKLIGATAHYVTADLDEGPIIEQDAERVSHRADPEELVRRGRDIERRVLARAVRWHLQSRILANGGKTIVFSE